MPPVWTFQLLFLLLVSFHHATANCGDPTVPTNGSIVGAYQNATEGAEIVFGCNSGFYPTENMTAVCEADGRWNPDPATLMCTLPLLPWHIALVVVSALFLLITLAVILTGMLALCGFRWCCWSILIVVLFSTIVGIPCGIALIVYSSKKAERNKESSDSATSSSKGTYSSKVGSYWGFYQGLTTIAYSFMLNGLSWCVVFAVVASRPPTNDSRRRITRDALVVFCFSVVALVLAIVGAVFIIPYRKYKSECKNDYGEVGVYHRITDGDNPDSVRIKDAEDF